MPFDKKKKQQLTDLRAAAPRIQRSMDNNAATMTDENNRLVQAQSSYHMSDKEYAKFVSQNADFHRQFKELQTPLQLAISRRDNAKNHYGDAKAAYDGYEHSYNEATRDLRYWSAREKALRARYKAAKNAQTVLAFLKKEGERRVENRITQAMVDDFSKHANVRPGNVTNDPELIGGFWHKSIHGRHTWADERRQLPDGSSYTYKVDRGHRNGWFGHRNYYYGLLQPQSITIRQAVANANERAAFRALGLNINQAGTASDYEKGVFRDAISQKFRYENIDAIVSEYEQAASKTATLQARVNNLDGVMRPLAIKRDEAHRTWNLQHQEWHNKHARSEELARNIKSSQQSIDFHRSETIRYSQESSRLMEAIKGRIATGKTLLEEHTTTLRNIDDLATEEVNVLRGDIAEGITSLIGTNAVRKEDIDQYEADSASALNNMDAASKQARAQADESNRRNMKSIEISSASLLGAAAMDQEMKQRAQWLRDDMQANNARANAMSDLKIAGQQHDVAKRSATIIAAETEEKNRKVAALKAAQDEHDRKGNLHRQKLELMQLERIRLKSEIDLHDLRIKDANAAAARVAAASKVPGLDQLQSSLDRLNSEDPKPKADTIKVLDTTFNPHVPYDPKTFKLEGATSTEQVYAEEAKRIQRIQWIADENTKEPPGIASAQPDTSAKVSRAATPTSEGDWEARLNYSLRNLHKFPKTDPKVPAPTIDQLQSSLDRLRSSEDSTWAQKQYRALANIDREYDSEVSAYRSHMNQSRPIVRGSGSTPEWHRRIRNHLKSSAQAAQVQGDFYAGRFFSQGRGQQ